MQPAVQSTLKSDMPRSIIRCVLLGLCAVCSPLHAFSLTDYLLSARQRDPAFANAKAQYRAAEQRVRQARALLLPSLNYTGSATRSNYDQEALEDRRFNTEQWAYQLTQPVFRPANFHGLTQAQQQLAQANAQVAATESDLAARVATAWFDVLSTQQVLRAIQAQKQATQQQLASAKRSFEVGTASIADAREAQAKHDLVVAQEAQAESELMFKRAALAQVSGARTDDIDPVLWMSPNLASRIGTLEDWIAQANESNPSIIQARYQLAAAHSEISKARAAHLPTVDLTANYSFNNASGSSTSEFKQHNKTTQYGVSVSIPLFSGFGTDAKVKEALALEDKANGDVAQASDQVELGIKQAYFGLKGALGQIPALDRARESNQVAVQANQRGYQVGMRTNVDVLNALAQLFQTEKDLAKARTDAWLNYIKLRIQTGKWTENDLRAF